MSPNCTLLGHRQPVLDHSHLDPESLAQMAGHFAVRIENDQSTSLYVSPDGVTQLFYAVRNGSLYSGSTVTEVTGAAGLSWEWNPDAFGDLAIFGHLLGDATLHGEVRRVGASELIRWDGKSLTRCTLHPTKHETDAVKPATPDLALDIFLDSVRSQIDPGDVISMSAGFDSRLILAAHLALGLRPRLLVMGPPEATDVSIALAIAKRFGLEIEQVSLSGAWMLSDRLRISRETSGTKTVDNWHTYEYVAASRHRNGIWIGSNGEFARTFFVDRGAMFVAANASGHFGIDRFWEAKLRRSAVPAESLPNLAQAFSENLIAVHRRKQRLRELFPEASLGAVNDALYLERVRQFISNGLRLVSMHAKPKTPFLEPRWVNAIRRLPRKYKLANWWHRFAIGKLAPNLLEFPFDASGSPMGKSPGLRYWLGLSPHSVSVPYFEYEPWVRQPAFIEAVQRASPYVGDVFKGFWKPAESPVRATTFFATLAFFRQMACQEDSASSRD